MTDISTTSTGYRATDDVAHDTPTRMTLDIPSRVVFKVLLIASLFALGISMVQQLTGLIVQIAIAAFLAIAADPLVRKMEHRGIGRGRGVTLVMLGALAVLGLVMAVFVPPLVDQADKLIDNAPDIVRDVQRSDLFERLDEQFGIIETASDQAARLPGLVSDQIGTVVGAVAAGVLGTITIIFLTVFLLLGGGTVVEGTVRVFPKLVERRWWTIIQGAYTGIAAYVGGAIIIAIIGGSVVALSAFFLDLPYALPLGLWMALLEIIPLVGATIGAVPAIIVAFVAGGVWQGVTMVIIVILYQQLENLVIQPRVQGRAAALSPLVVFVAVLVGSQLLGVLGALFAVPVAGVLQIFVRQLIDDQGSGELQVPAVAASEGQIQAPDIDGDGKPGRSAPDGTPL